MSIGRNARCIGLTGTCPRRTCRLLAGSDSRDLIGMKAVRTGRSGDRDVMCGTLICVSLERIFGSACRSLDIFGSCGDSGSCVALGLMKGFLCR